MRVLIFGDSIAQGFWDAYGGWVQRLAHEYHPRALTDMLAGKGDGNEVFNLGISGDTAAGLAKRLEAEVAARQLYPDSDVIVIAIGINDAALRANRAELDVYGFQLEIDKALDIALRITDKVMLVGLTAVDENLTDPWKYSSTGKQWHNARINAFEDTIKQSAERKDVPFVPIHDRFMAALEAGQDLLADGLHPNEAGHQFITELVKPVLDELIAS